MENEKREDWVFINIDTLGLSENAKILSIGLLYVPNCNLNGGYAELSKNTLDIKFNVEEQPNRTIDIDTLKLWMNRKDTSFILSDKNRFSLEKGYLIIKRFLEMHSYNAKESKIFSRWPSDVKWWNSYCEYIKCPSLFPFYNWRDVRTLLDLLDGNPDRKQIFENTYKSSNECIEDYMNLRDAFEKFFS